MTFSSPGSYYVRAQANPTAVNANSGWSPIERAERFALAYFRTVKAWFDEGLVVVKR